MIEMMKYLFIEINSIYIYSKLLGENLTRKMFFFSAFYSLFIALSVKWTRMYAPVITIPFLIISIMIFMSFFYKTSMQTHTSTAIISTAITYSIYTILTLIVVAFFFVLSMPLSQHYFLDRIADIIIGGSELLFSLLIFRSKRFRKGIPSLKQRGANTIGILISGVILFLASLFTPSIQVNWLQLSIIIMLLVFSCLLYLWWQIRIKKDYIARVRARELLIMQNELNEKENEIAKLQTHNNMLANIIHRDNKLIPAMESAVRDCLTMTQENVNIDEISEKATVLLQQLQEMTRERTGIIIKYENQSKRLPSVNAPSVDILLSYLYKKAETQQVTLTFSFSGNVAEFINRYINEMDLQTILADLVENAINATQSCVKRAVNIEMSLNSDTPVIHICDSGVLFTIDVLSQIGLRRVTTRKEQKDRGIGLMSTFTILHGYKASFEIEEYANNDNYTKRISIYFDSRNEYRIKSLRKDELMSISKRIDLVLLP
jgi:Histidine kinase-, DNA gyrase B-, and HSP90-like ATPase.